MAVWEIVKANIKSKKGNFISILLLLILISMAVSTVVSMQGDYTEKIKQSCTYSSVADISCFIKGDRVSDEMISEISDMNQVSSVLVRDGVSTKPKNLTVNGEHYGSSAIFLKYNPKEHKYHLYDESGTAYTEFRAPQEGEIYLPVTMRDTVPCEIGDKIEISNDGWKKSLTIAGFYEEPMTGGSLIGVKLFLVSDADFAQLAADETLTGFVSYPLVEIWLKADYQAQANEVKKEINERTGIVDAGFYTMLLSQSLEYTGLFVTILNTVFAALSLVLFFVVLVIIGHNVNTTIEMEQKQLGILKSLGFTSWSLRASILFEYLLAWAAASVLGMVASSFLIRYLNLGYIPVTGILIRANIRFVETLLFLLLILFVITCYTVFRSRKITAISPVQAISDGLSPVHFSARTDFDLTKARVGTLSMHLTAKQLLGNWKKYVTNLIVIAVLIFFTMTISSIRQISDTGNMENIFGSYQDDISVNYNEDTADRVKEIRAQIDQSLGIEKEFVLSNEYVSVDGNEILAKVLDKSENIQEVLEGRIPKYDNEIAMTEMTCNLLGKQIGDSVEIKAGDTEASYLIVGTYQSTSDAGISVTMLESAMKRMIPSYDAHTVYYEVKDKDKIEQVVKELSKKYQDFGEALLITNDSKAAEETDGNMLMIIDSLTFGAYVLAFVFAALISLMICRKNFLMEQRDLGVYKSLGYTSAGLRRQFTAKYLVVAVCSALLGILLNLLFNDRLLTLLFSSIGISRFTTRYSFELLFMPSLFMLMTTTLFAWISSRRIRQVSPKNLINE